MTCPSGDAAAPRSRACVWARSRRVASRIGGAGGTTIREIAGELGVSVSSVHNYLNAVDCPDCGCP